MSEKYYKGSWENLAYDWFTCTEKSCKVYHTTAREPTLEISDEATEEAEKGYYKFLHKGGYPKVNIKVREYKTRESWEQAIFLEKV